MGYTIEQLLNVEFDEITNEELENIIVFVNIHYFEDNRYSEILEEAKAEQDLRLA